jgi:hypothetical protein
MTRLRIWFALVLCLLSGAVAAEDTIYRCRSADGADVYSDKPCAAAKDMQRIKIEPGPLPDITDVKALCSSEDGARRELASLNGKVLAGLPQWQRRSVADAMAEYVRGGSRPGARWGRGAQESVHLCLPTFADEIVEYVATTDGKLIQMRGGMVSYLNDPDTPSALLQRCEDTWNQCVAAPDSDPDACVTQIPTCTTNEPWKGGRNCCPLECKTAYNERRSSGLAGTTAFLGSLYDSPSCVPGVARTR